MNGNGTLFVLLIFSGAFSRSEQLKTETPNPGANRAAVLDYKPPRVVIVDTGLAKVLSTIPLADHPTKMLLSKRGDFLYVLNYGGGCERDLLFPEPPSGRQSFSEWKKPSSISVIDLEKRRVVKILDLSWGVNNLQLTEDGRYIVVVGAGKHSKGKARPNEMGMVHLIDTQTNEVVSRTVVGRDQTAMVATRNAGRIFSLAANDYEGEWSHSGWAYVTAPEARPCGYAKTPKPGSFTLSVLGAAQTRPLAEIPLPGMPSILKLSKDELWLYVLDLGRPDKNPEKNREATVYVIDVEKAALKDRYGVGAKPVGWEVDPQKDEFRVLSQRSVEDDVGILSRFEGGALRSVTEVVSKPLMLWQSKDFPQPVVVGKNEACLIDEKGRPQRPCFDLSNMEFTRRVTCNECDRNLKMEIAYLPQRPGLLFRSGRHGDQVMLADLVQHKTEPRFSLGSEGARTRKLAGNVAGDVLVGILTLGRINPPDMDMPWQRTPVLQSPDARSAYITNTYTNEISELDTQSGKIEKFFPLGSFARGLALSPNGKLLGAFSKKKVLLIDTSTDEVRVDSDPPGDAIALLWIDGGARFLVQTTTALVIWETDSGQRSGVLNEFSRAIENLPIPAMPSTATCGYPKAVVEQEWPR